VAKPSEKLAESLEALHTLQAGGLVAIRSRDLSRTHRERLVENGFLEEVIKGWYIPARPDESAGESTAWYASFWTFCAAYLEHLKGKKWCLSPEQSISIHAENWTIPRQLPVRAAKARNNITELPYGTSLLDVRASIPKDKDIVVLSTKSFNDLVGEGVLKAGLSRGDLSECAEYVAPKIHASEKESRSSAVFVKFGTEYEAKIERLGLTKEEKPKLKKKAKSGPLNFFAKIPRRNLFVKTAEIDLESEKRKKTTFSIGIILLIMLAVSIFFGIRQKRRSDFLSSFNESFAQAKHNYEESLTLYSLNSQRARELFSLSQKSAQDLINQGFDEPELLTLYDQLKIDEGRILGIYKNEPSEFVDFSLLTDNFSGEKMSLVEEGVYVLDPSGEKVIEANIRNGGSEVVAGPAQVKGSEDIASYSGLLYLLKDDGIYEAIRDREKVVEKDWDGKVNIFSYAGNIYLLEKDYGRILRFIRGNTRFSSGNDWLSAGVVPNFTNTIDWAIDGAIWILNMDGVLEKYTYGNPQAFSIKGVSPELSEPKAIFTSDETEYLYILDADRVVVINKDGDFVAQYVSDKLKDMVDLVVSESEKKIILLSKDKLYSVEIKHVE